MNDCRIPKLRKWFIAILMGAVIFTSTPVMAGSQFVSPSAGLKLDTDPYSLINEVNALRAENGLPAYSANPILMSVAQQHAQYMSVAGVTHYGADGSSPWQRGLAAGYPLAGDLSRGGFYSENILAGNEISVQEAVKDWQGDAPHLWTMLSPNLTEIGAGVVTVGGYVYYVIDCAQPTNSRQPQIYTPVPGAAKTAEAAPLVFNTLIPETPLVDGKIFHVVKPGETLWLIAVSYGVKIAELRSWNNLSTAQSIYPGNKLFVKQADRPTVIPASSTPTSAPTLVPTGTVTPVPSSTITATPKPIAAYSMDSSSLVLVSIVFAALILAAVFVRAGQKE